MKYLRLPCLLAVLLLSEQQVDAQMDKQVLGDAVLTPMEIAEGASVMYLVRFQNISTDTARQIIVRDTLDPRLDANSFDMVAASHDYELLRDGSNVVRWYFTDINLPDSTTNYPESLGFVLFTVRPKQWLAPGQTIGNTAFITLDEQPAIATNEAIVWIDADSDVDEPWVNERFQVVPNPNHGQFEIRPINQHQPDTSTEWWITDINGKTIWDGRAENPAGANYQVWLERPSPGLYLLWVKSAEILKVEQFAVIR